MYRSKSDRMAARRLRKFVNERFPHCKEHFDKQNMRKYNFTKFCHYEKIDKRIYYLPRLDKLREQHFKLDMKDLDNTKHEEIEASLQIEYDLEYHEDMQYRDFLDLEYRDFNNREYHDMFTDDERYEESETWSIYHEFLSVDAHNRQLRQRYDDVA